MSANTSFCLGNENNMAYKQLQCRLYKLELFISVHPLNSLYIQLDRMNPKPSTALRTFLLRSMLELNSTLKWTSPLKQRNHLYFTPQKFLIVAKSKEFSICLSHFTLLARVIYNMISECMSISFAFLELMLEKKSDPLPSFEPDTSRIEILNATTAPQNLLINFGS